MPVVDAAIEVVRPAADAKEITIDVNYDALVSVRSQAMPRGCNRLSGTFFRTP